MLLPSYSCVLLTLSFQVQLKEHSTLPCLPKKWIHLPGHVTWLLSNLDHDQLTQKKRKDSKGRPWKVKSKQLTQFLTRFSPMMTSTHVKKGIGKFGLELELLFQVWGLVKLMESYATHLAGIFFEFKPFMTKVLFYLLSWLNHAFLPSRRRREAMRASTHQYYTILDVFVSTLNPGPILIPPY